MSIALSLLALGCASQAPGIVLDPNTINIAVEVRAADDDLSFWDVPPLDEAVIDTAPEDRSDGLAVGKLGLDGGNEEALLVLAREIAAGKHGDYDSLLVAHRGRLLFESYFLSGRVNLTHPQVSATKSYTALALGRAIQLGYLSLEDLDRPLIDFLGRLDRRKFVDGAELITLHKALSMSSGLRLTEAQLEEIEESPDRTKGQGQVQAYLESSAAISTDSQTFLYQGTDPNLVMQVIEAVVPGTAEDFMKAELFDKMGIATYSWQRDASGLPRGGDRASLTSRAMVKWGLLVLNDGKWRGIQLVPEAYIAKLTSRAVRLSGEEAFFTADDVTNPGYGYLWWQADMKSEGQSYFSSSAQGGGGQHIIVIKELDLVVVVTAHGEKSLVMQLTPRRILPAFAKRAP